MKRAHRFITHALARKFSLDFSLSNHLMVKCSCYDKEGLVVVEIEILPQYEVRELTCLTLFHNT